MPTSVAPLDHRFCVAPMLDCTDRHSRYLFRLISHRAVLYTEMVTTGALLHGDVARFLHFNTAEHPLALQLGGSDPAAMAQCAELAQAWYYDEVNINVGCPSDRVQSGAFGACLMQSPALVAENVRAMRAVTDIPVTIKCRIGVDEQEPRVALWALVEASAAAGCSTFIVHARKAWLKGLSPKQNRDVPPLDYELVYQLKRDFPELTIVLNGGISSIAQAQTHLAQVDGVMMGREAYANPYVLCDVDHLLYAHAPPAATRDQVFRDYLAYAQMQCQQGVRINHLTRHAFGLFHGQPRARIWRRYLSDHAHLPDADFHVLQDAYEAMLA